MKRNLMIFAMVAMLSAIFFAGCENDSTAGGGGNSSGAATLSERLLNASDGDVIDLKAEGLVVDKTSYTLTKSVTIKNGDLDGVTFNVENGSASGRSVSRAADGSAIVIVLDSLLNFLFNMNTPADVQMHGSNSKHVRMNSKGGHVKLSGKSRVSELAVNADEISVNSEDADSNIMVLSASENANKMELAGSGKITTLLSASDDLEVDATGAVKIEASDVEVTGATVDAKFKKVLADKVYYCTSNAMPEITSGADGVYSHTIPKSDEIWNEWIDVFLGITDSEGGENYKVVFDVKTDVDATLPLKVRTNYCDGNERVLKTIKDTWYPVTIYTGIYWEKTERYILELPADNPDSDVTISLRNIRYCKASEDDENAPKFASSGYYMMRDDGSVSVSHDGVATVEFKKDAEKLWEQGANILPFNLTYGKWNKITYKIRTQNATSKFSCSTSPRVKDIFQLNKRADGVGDTYGTNWSWSEVGAIPADTDITAVAYIHALKGYATDPYDEKDGENKPFVKIYLSDTTANTITFKDFSVETMDSAPSDMTFMWHRGYTNGEEDYSVSVVDDDFCFKVPAKGSVCAEGVLAKNPSDPWNTTLDSEKNTATSAITYVLWDGIKNDIEGIEIQAIEAKDVLDRDAGFIKFVNTTSGAINLTVALTDKGLHFAKTEKAAYETYIIGNPHESEIYKNYGAVWEECYIRTLNAEAGKYYRVTGKVQVTDANPDDPTGNYVAFQIKNENGNVVDLGLPIDGSEFTLDNIFPCDENQEMWAFVGGNIEATVKIFDLVIEETEAPRIVDAWYYYDVEVPAEVTVLNIIFNAGGKQTVDILGLSFEHNVYAYAWWNEDEADSDGHYACSPLADADMPTAAPEDGKIRIYWNAKLTEGVTPNLYYWGVKDGGTENPVEWPGVQMTKFSE